MQFLLKYELKNNFSFHDDDDDDNSNSNSDVNPSQFLWAYRQFIVYPSIDRNVFFSNIFKHYGSSASDHVAVEMEKYATQQTKSQVLSGISDKNIFEFLRVYFLSLYEMELTGKLPKNGIKNDDTVSKHKYYKKFNDDRLRHGKFCENCGIQDTIDNKLLTCSCLHVKYCNKVCLKANWKIHKKYCNWKKEGKGGDSSSDSNSNSNQEEN